MVLEIFLTKNYSTECMERKKSEHILGRTNRRRLVLCPTKRLVIVNLYTKYEISVLYSCGDIFDEKKERKKNKYREEQIGEGSFSIPRYAIVNLYNKYEVSVLNGFRDIFDKKKQY